jgi:hypothetical protein
LLCSCGSQKLITGNYYFDNEFEIIQYKFEDDIFVGIVSGRIVDLAYNDKYIIAKRNPENTNIKIINKDSVIITHDGLYMDSVEYYIICVSKTYTSAPEKGIIGPMDSLTFRKKLQALNSNLSFTTN